MKLSESSFSDCGDLYIAPGLSNYSWRNILSIIPFFTRMNKILIGFIFRLSKTHVNR
jgi:hypothetical protein